MTEKTGEAGMKRPFGLGLIELSSLLFLFFSNFFQLSFSF